MDMSEKVNGVAQESVECNKDVGANVTPSAGAEARLDTHLQALFAPHEKLRPISELKEELRGDLVERLTDLRAQGLSDEDAYQATIDSIGDIEQTIVDIAADTRVLERSVSAHSFDAYPPDEEFYSIFTQFASSDLRGADFRKVAVPGGRFSASSLKGADFSGAYLAGSNFKASDLHDAVFEGANLAECDFSASNLRGVNLRNCALVRARLNSTDLRGVELRGADLTEAKLRSSNLRGTDFEGCTLTRTDFSYSDLTEANFDGLTLEGTVFKSSSLVRASFRKATLRKVSLKNLPRRALKGIVFEDTVMDKLTYALIKNIGGADLSDIVVVD
jgi:uncharacterized protein YjbI with pentapeptide repeats